MASSVARVVGIIITVVIGILLGWLAAFHLPGSEKAQQDPEAETHTLGDTLSGEITSASETNFNDGSHYAKVPVQIEEGDVFVQFELEGALNGTLSLLNDNNEWLASSATGSSYDSSDTASSVGVNIDEPGTYWLAVSGSDQNSYGPFRVSSRTLDVQNSGDVAIGNDLSGFLADSSNTYQVNIEEAGLYRFTMRSDVVDSYLALNGNGVSASDDDSAGSGYDAQLDTYLEPGEYELEASAYGSVQQGVYTLESENRPLPEGENLRNEGDVSVDDELTGFLSGGERTYTLNVEEPTSVTIDMRSDAIDSYLDLNGNGISMSDDDGGNGYDSQIQAVLEPGTYQVKASGYGYSSGGIFTLTLASSEVNMLSAEERQFEGEGTLSDTLTSSEGTDFTLNVAEAGTYAITMRSNTVDSYLSLDGNGVQVSDDDSGGGASGYDARIETNLEPGSYTLNASSYGGSTGNFDLRVEAVN